MKSQRDFIFVIRTKKVKRRIPWGFNIFKFVLFINGNGQQLKYSRQLIVK